MFIKTLRSFVAFTFLVTGAASAQTIAKDRNEKSPASESAPKVPFRIQLSINSATPIPAATSNTDQRKLSEAERLSIYEITNSECAILSKIFKADCRLVSLNSSSSIQDRGSAGSSTSASGTATYELTVRDR